MKENIKFILTVISAILLFIFCCFEISTICILKQSLFSPFFVETINDSSGVYYRLNDVYTARISDQGGEFECFDLYKNNKKIENSSRFTEVHKTGYSMKKYLIFGMKEDMRMNKKMNKIHNRYNKFK